MISRVVLYTAPGCHLCGPALEAVRSVCGSDFELVDITTDTALEKRYRERIPVVEVDGVERFRYHVDEDELRARVF
ncbi:MAG TPA: glutaredoxin family protein [Gaiella sp.]|jgi:glutaredoxin-related protein|nr:glutaredoxin family protein [Gaiella sp.]